MCIECDSEIFEDGIGLCLLNLLWKSKKYSGNCKVRLGINWIWYGYQSCEVGKELSIFSYCDEVVVVYKFIDSCDQEYYDIGFDDVGD